MKVNELYDGIVLRVSDDDNRVWLTNDSIINLPSGDRELRFILASLSGMVPGILLSPDDLIIYLGAEATTIDDSYTQLMRRVYVNGYIAVVQGSNFRYLEPHPRFVAPGE